MNTWFWETKICFFEMKNLILWNENLILWNYFEIKAATNEVDMATKPSFGKSEGG